MEFKFTPHQRKKLVNAGLSRQYISGLERKKHKPGFAKAQIISKTLKVGLRRVLSTDDSAENDGIANRRSSNDSARL